MCSIGKKSLKLDEKTKRKTEGLIDEKPPKPDEETRRKTDYLYVARVKNLRNLARKTVEENLILIGDRDELSGSTA